MRLEPIGRLEMHYDPKAAWLRPNGEKEGAGFGFGSGRMVGLRLQGSVISANHPRRREDGVWCPDCHGFVTTHDGAKVVFSLHGYSIDETTTTLRRAIVAAVWLRAQEEQYRWLNYHLCVGEGEMDEETEMWWFEIRAIMNEVAVAPPKLARAKPAMSVSLVSVAGKTLVAAKRQSSNRGR
jgi:hypothetical protein